VIDYSEIKTFAKLPLILSLLLITDKIVYVNVKTLILIMLFLEHAHGRPT